MSAEGKISLALGGAKKGKLAPGPTNGVKRSHAALQEDGEDEEHLDGKAQTVSHFDKAAGGAIDEANRPKKEQPLVIQPQTNRDWRAASQRNKRQKVPEALQQNGDMGDLASQERASKPTYGLNVTRNGNQSVSREEPMDLEQAEQAQQVPLEPNGEASVAQKTDDELAMDALLGKTKKSDLVVPAVTEEEAFERDFHSAPDMATLDDYARVPVEQFGAALLRGMGWKEGEGIGNQRGKKVEKTKLPERRPALLGIGAKEEAAVKEEMGAWGRSARGGKEVRVYNPVLLKDKRTGELFTEEEAEKRRLQQEREKYESEFESKERERETRLKDKERDRKSEKDRNGRYRRRDDSDEDYYRRKEEKRERREREQQESDEEYYRRKKKDKRRRERDRDHRDSDRERSKRHDGERDRHGSRDRDSRKR